MNTLLNKVIRKAKTTLTQTADKVKERIFSLTGTPSANVQQLADYVLQHPDTKVMKKELLGFTFSFYTLDTDNMNFYLETKNSYILQMDVTMSDERIISYRSYRDHHLLHTPIKTPEFSPLKKAEA